MAENTQPLSKEVNYLGKDFASLRNNLIDFARIYFPNSYNDFNEASPGMLFIEMAAYVGDVLNYYIDNAVRENLLLHAKQRKNIYEIAESLGYKPKVTSPAKVKLQLYQTVPVNGSGVSSKPDYDYALTINQGSEFSSTSNPAVTFITDVDVNFSVSSSVDTTNISVYSVEEGTSQPLFYLLKKEVQATAATLKTQTFPFGTPEKFGSVKLPDNNVIRIISCTDSDGNKWHEVPFLGQETIFDEVENNAKYDTDLAQYSDTAPYLLRLKKSSRRYTTRINSDNTTNIEFGGGISSDADSHIIPNPDNVGSTLPEGLNSVDTNVDPSNFMYTRTYGQVPSNTTLSFRYLVGGGLQTNVTSNDITTVKSISTIIDDFGKDATKIATAKASVVVNNEQAATGGGNAESLDEIKLNTLANFAAQGRVVTKEDFIIRTYTMPPRLGAVMKAYIVQDEQLNESEVQQKKENDEKVLNRIANPLAMNLYTLGYTGQKNLTQVNPAIKGNLKNYLGQFRMLTDAINIKDAFIINIGVNFDLVPVPTQNANVVLLRCIDTVKQFFEIDKWQINQPILIADLQRNLFLTEGVSNIPTLEIVNKYDTELNYSGNVYNIQEATRDNIVYPSLDPSVFEVKFPNTDIQGRVVT
jgi:hypothetical protein